MGTESTAGLRLANVLDDILLVPRSLATPAQRASAEPPFSLITRLSRHLSNPARSADLQSFIRDHGLVPPMPMNTSELARRLEEVLRSGDLLVLREPRRRVVTEVELGDVIGPDPNAITEDDL